MHRAFQRLNQVLDLLVARPQSRVHRDWRHYKSLPGLGIAFGGQAPAEQIVYGPLERVAGAPDLLLDKAGDVVVNRESSSHIMMLFSKTS